MHGVAIGRVGNPTAADLIETTASGSSATHRTSAIPVSFCLSLAQREKRLNVVAIGATLFLTEVFMPRRSKFARLLLIGIAFGLGAGTAAARPRVCVDSCTSFGCRVCSFACSSLDCYADCMGAYPSC